MPQPSPLRRMESSARTLSHSRSPSLPSRSPSPEGSEPEEGPFDPDLDLPPTLDPRRMHLYPRRRAQDPSASLHSLEGEGRGDSFLTASETAAALEKIHQYREVFERQQQHLRFERARLENPPAPLVEGEGKGKGKGKGRGKGKEKGKASKGKFSTIVSNTSPSERAPNTDDDPTMANLPFHIKRRFELNNWPLSDGQEVELKWTRYEMDTEMLGLEHERMRREGKIARWREMESGSREGWKNIREGDLENEFLEGEGDGEGEEGRRVCEKHGYVHYQIPDEKEEEGCTLERILELEAEMDEVDRELADVGLVDV